MGQQRFKDWQVSYWQQGCNDAKAGGNFNETMRFANGYEQGYWWGQHGKSKPEPEPFRDFEADAAWLEELGHEQFPNPYMEGIFAIEGILARLQIFTKDQPEVLDKAKVEEYSSHMLEVRDTLHRFRQAELVTTQQGL